MLCAPLLALREKMGIKEKGEAGKKFELAVYGKQIY